MSSMGPELGGLLLGAPVLTDKIVDEIAADSVRDFLASINPVELEAAALSRLGGLEGQSTLGEALLKVLHEMADL